MPFTKPQNLSTIVLKTTPVKEQKKESDSRFYGKNDDVINNFKIIKINKTMKKLHKKKKKIVTSFLRPTYQYEQIKERKSGENEKQPTNNAKPEAKQGYEIELSSTLLSLWL